MKIRIEVLKEDILTSDNSNVEDCPITKALKRKFPNTKIIVGGSFCYIGIYTEKIFFPHFTVERLYLMDIGSIKVSSFTFILNIP